MTYYDSRIVSSDLSSFCDLLEEYRCRNMIYFRQNWCHTSLKVKNFVHATLVSKILFLTAKSTKLMKDIWK